MVFTTQGLWTAQRAMRTERWILVKTIDPGLWALPATELFDRRADPREERDLAAVKEEVRDRLELQYTHWLEGVLGNRPDPIRVEASKGCCSLTVFGSA